MCKIDFYLNDAWRYLLKKYGVNRSSQIIAPLEWYIRTGRASADWEKHLMGVKPYVVCRILEKHYGTYEEPLELITSRIYKGR